MDELDVKGYFIFPLNEQDSIVLYLRTDKRELAKLIRWKVSLEIAKSLE